MNMSGPPGVRVVVPGIRSRLDRNETIVTVLVSEGPACTGKVRIKRGWMIVSLMEVAAPRVCLPDLDQHIPQWPAVVANHPPRDDDSLPKRLARMLLREVAITLLN